MESKSPIEPREPLSWLIPASERAVVAVSAGIALFIFCVIRASDWLMFDAGIPPFTIMLGSDALAAILTFGFIYHIIHTWHERRQTVRRELQIIGETNHHIRNALELIQLSAQTTHNQDVIAKISVGVERIQWVLRELLGENSFCGITPREDQGKGKEMNERIR